MSKVLDWEQAKERLDGKDEVMVTPVDPEGTVEILAGAEGTVTDEFLLDITTVPWWDDLGKEAVPMDVADPHGTIVTASALVKGTMMHRAGA